MGTTQEFFEESLDKTPYPSFIGVIIIGVAFFCIAGFSLIQIAGWAKTRTWSFTLKAPTLTLPSPTSLQGVKDAAQAALQAQEQKAAQAAATAAANQAQQQVNQAVNQGTQSLNQFLH